MNFVPDMIVIILRQTDDYGVYGYGSGGRELIGEPCATIGEAEEVLRQAAADAYLDVGRDEIGQLVAY